MNNMRKNFKDSKTDLSRTYTWNRANKDSRKY